MKYFIAVFIMLFSIGVQADTCKNLSELATNVMEARQIGVPMSEMMDKMEGEDLFERMVIQAYDSPRYSTEKYKREAMTEFGNEWYSLCLKSYEN